MKIKLLVTFFLLSVSFIFGVSDKYFDLKAILPVDPDEKSSLKADAGWYNDSVFYHLWIKGFADSDGDGIGDLKGIISKLDYLNDGNPETKNDLGITGIWLSPVFECDYKGANMHGYDTIDYYNVNSTFGTNEDLEQLLVEAHKRGIRIIFDYVSNHVSDKHPWFLEAKDGGKKKKWFIWDKKPDTGWQSAWGGGNWGSVWHKWEDSYFYGAFWKGMPDLNFNNKEARTAITNVMIYWLNKGFDGVRMDAVRYIYEDGPGLAADRPKTHDYLKKLKTIVNEYDQYGYKKMMVSEAWTDFDTIKDYYGDGKDEFDMSFDFPMAYIIKDAVTSGADSKTKGIVEYVNKQIATYPEGFRTALFITNHDEVAERPGTLYKEDSAKIKLAGALSLLLPGTPFIYYGNEIGMKNGDLKGDQRLRTMLDWAEVEKQIKTNGSVFQSYRDLVDLKNKSNALKNGGFTALETGVKKTIAFVRTVPEEDLLVVCNFNNPQITLKLQIGRDAEKVIGDCSVSSTNGVLTIDNLKPYSYSVFRLK